MYSAVQCHIFFKMDSALFLNIPQTVLWTEVDLSLPIAASNDNLIKLRMPQASSHTLVGREQEKKNLKVVESR
jgi:hypothetical protein